MITDSQRIAERTCRRLIPTARSNPSLVGAFVDRQGQRVDHADERDDHREEQQP